MIVTSSPRSSWEPGPGSWPITVPSGSSASRVSTFGIRPSRRICDSADLLLATRPGPAGGSGSAPLETNSVTVDSAARPRVPRRRLGRDHLARGLTSREDVPRAVDQQLLVLRAASRASRSDSPRRRGTSTVGPRLTVRVTVEPSSASLPAARILLGDRVLAGCRSAPASDANVEARAPRSSPGASGDGCRRARRGRSPSPAASARRRATAAEQQREHRQRDHPAGASTSGRASSTATGGRLGDRAAAQRGPAGRDRPRPRRARR